MKIIQNEITGNPTSLPTNFGGKLRFILSVLFPERLRSTAAAHIFGAKSNYFVIMGWEGGEMRRTISRDNVLIKRNNWDPN